MKKDYNTFALMHRIATGLRPRNDECVHNRHCERPQGARQSGTTRHRNPLAFSLIELLISLIIISLITAAFAPIITKKVSSGFLSVSSVFNKNIYDDDDSNNKKDKDKEYVDPSCRLGPNEECCKKFDSLYVSKTNTPGYTGEDLCVLKYNAGDDRFIMDDDYYHPEYAKIGIQMIDAGGITCSNSASCCFRGSTAQSTSANWNYSGQNRTVCTFKAALSMCKNWAPYGTRKGSWRLPTEGEMIALSGAIAKDTAQSAKVTKYLNGEGLQLCDQSTNGQGANRCNETANCPGATGGWCIPSTVWAQSKVSFMLTNGSFSNVYSGTDYAKTVRCVNPHPGRVIGKEEERTPTEGEPKNQADCDPFEAVFIDAKHTGNKNICMTKYNPGEGNIAFNFGDAGAQLVKGGQSCASSGGCCWQSKTSATYGGNYSYSGQNRTVCTYKAAKNLCETHQPKGFETTGKWRLPTTSELNNLSLYIAADSNYSKFLSKYLDEKGLQFCDQNSTGYGANRCLEYVNCPGAAGNWCIPSTVWADGNNSFMLTNGSFSNVYSGTDYAKTVRCVSDNISYKAPKTPEPVGYEPTKEDCDEFDAIFIERKYTGTKNLCMLKYNPAEGSTSFNFGVAGVQLVKGGQPCQGQGGCCWQGNTSATYGGNYSYSGQNRTVCTYQAAKSLCENYQPNTEYGANWRLATATETDKIATYISASGHLFSFLSKYLNTDGLQFCDQSSSEYGSNRCLEYANCPGAAGNWCIPAAIWADSNNSVMLSNGTFARAYNNTGYAKGARCVSDSPKKPDSTIKRTPTSLEPRDQRDCDKYNAIFIDAKYTGSSNLCMTKTNFADAQGGVVLGTNTPEDYSKIGVTIVDAAKGCSGNCCWKGNTAASVSGNYNYNGFGRTVCNFAAAKKLCSNYKLGNPTTKWRLLTPSEANIFATYVSASGHLSPFLSKFLNDEGLQLCDNTTSAQGANRCGEYANCPGAAGSYCIPADVWVDNSRSYLLTNGSFLDAYSGTDYAKSVRCVTDRVQR